jgi:23S rRNA pseudouridine2605 synthase
LSRRAADDAISQGRVTVNGQLPTAGQDIAEHDNVQLDNRRIQDSSNQPITIILHKPAGYVVSRNGQGSKTVYDLLPQRLHHLKPIGRLDKDSSGILLLTTDGQLAEQLTHPKYQKQKRYEIQLDKPLAGNDQTVITGPGVELEDGPSILGLTEQGNRRFWLVTMREGRNRQIRRTFDTLGYEVVRLHRVSFGDYRLSGLESGLFMTAPTLPGSANPGASTR